VFLLAGLALCLGQTCVPSSVPDPVDVPGPVDTAVDQTDAPTPLPDDVADPSGEPPVSTLCGTYAPECLPAEGAAPVALAAGDLDGDGDLDLGVLNQGTNNVSILLNEGDGTFAPGSRYAVADYAQTIAGGDLDQDGDLDLIVHAGFGVSLLLNEGNASFIVDSTLDTYHQTSTTADIDADGDLDLALTDYEGVTPYLNEGDASFNEGQTVFFADAYSFTPQYMTSADLNGDSRVDLVVVTTTPTWVFLLINRGSATLDSPIRFDVGDDFVPFDVKSADLDGDGDADVVVAGDDYSTATSNPAGIQILFNQGGETLAPPTGIQADSPGGWADSVLLADLDADGDLDLTATHRHDDLVSVFFNQGNGTFQPAPPLKLADDSGPVFVAAADLDGDGDLDLAVANNRSNSVAIFFNDGSGAFLPSSQ